MLSRLRLRKEIRSGELSELTVGLSVGRGHKRASGYGGGQSDLS